INARCERCPQNAICNVDRTVICEDGFILKSHLLSLTGSTYPLPWCGPAPERARQIDTTFTEIVTMLQQQVTKAWRERSIERVADSRSVQFKEADVKNEVKQKIKPIAEVDFNTVWDEALRKVEAKGKVIRDSASKSLALISPPTRLVIAELVQRILSFVFRL
ncbi:Man1-Src1p-C-terminal domain-containing protein, partial [Aspergillus flavus]